MSTNETPTQESFETTDEPFTYHIEPPEQGGERYARCTDCGREILCCIGEEKLTHADGCSNGE